MVGRLTGFRKNSIMESLLYERLLKFFSIRLQIIEYHITKRGKEMCYYIGIEDLAANALIEILQTKEKSDFTQCYVTFKELEDYGAAVIQYLNEKKGEKALLILSRAHTTNMFRNYSDFFKEKETPDGPAIELQKGKTVENLIDKFRVYNAVDLIAAFIATAEIVVHAAG